ncbi:MAG: apolipoprotein N-acyltransferase [Deltaproteobacteria bacterium]|nr:apolipoprotein N-acyltransferase [Deltaproteobacteria bacterium]
MSVSEIRSPVEAETRPPSGRRGALVLYAVFTFLAFPHELPFAGGLGGVESVDLGFFFVWLAPAALVIGIDGLAPRRAARAAFWASLFGYTVFFYWFTVVTVQYGGMPLILGVLSPIVPALFVSVFMALFAWAWVRISSRSVVAIAVGAALWVAVDWTRGHFLGGFPWATLGYALHLDLPLMVWTRWAGVYGLSFVAAAVGLAIAHAWLERGALAYRRLALVLGFVFALHAIGLGVMAEDASDPERRRVRVAAIQGNIDQGEKWEADRRARILGTYLRLSEEAAGGDEALEWIVWPETAVPGLIENDPGLRSRLALLARRYDVSLVVGGMGVSIDEEGRRFSAFFDSAFQFDPDGEVRDRYDKTHLVPFGEFVPLRGLLGHFFQSLARGLSSTDVTAGSAVRNLELVAPGAGLGRISVGVPICYELLFPHLVRQFAGQGARILLAITNDAWYGRTGAPHQFLAMTAIRAAENGLPTLRAANTGISALIDGRGRVVSASSLFEEAIVLGDVAMPAENSGATFYARYGDVFAWSCMVVAIGMLLRSWIEERRCGPRNSHANTFSQSHEKGRRAR